MGCAAGSRCHAAGSIGRRVGREQVPYRCGLDSAARLVYSWVARLVESARQGPSPRGRVRSATDRGSSRARRCPRPSVHSEKEVIPWPVRVLSGTRHGQAIAASAPSRRSDHHLSAYDGCLRGDASGADDTRRRRDTLPAASSFFGGLPGTGHVTRRGLTRKRGGAESGLRRWEAMR